MVPCLCLIGEDLEVTLYNPILMDPHSTVLLHLIIYKLTKLESTPVHFLLEGPYQSLLTSLLKVS